MLIKNFFDAFQSGKELANATTWKNAQLLGSKLAIFLGALLPIANSFGYLPELTIQDTISVAGAIVVVAGLFNGTATVVSTTRIGLRRVPVGKPDERREANTVESPPSAVSETSGDLVDPRPVDAKPVEPDLFHNRSLG